MAEIKDSVAAVRKWQRHHLLRQFGDNGHVLPENIELSGHIDALCSAVERPFFECPQCGGDIAASECKCGAVTEPIICNPRDSR